MGPNVVVFVVQPRTTSSSSVSSLSHAILNPGWPSVSPGAFQSFVSVTRVVSVYALSAKTPYVATYLRHDDESSECATARQHKVAEVACYRIERTLMGCADPLQRGVDAPHQCSRVQPKTKWMGGVFHVRRVVPRLRAVFRRAPRDDVVALMQVMVPIPAVASDGVQPQVEVTLIFFARLHLQVQFIFRFVSWTSS